MYKNLKSLLPISFKAFPRRSLMRLKWFFIHKKVASWYYTNPVGSARWLCGAEARYGGLIMGLHRKKCSPHESITTEQLAKIGMTGGDRMFLNRYANIYSQELMPFLGIQKRIVLVEIGILRGTGLAIWCDLFPNGRVIGLDIDLTHVMGNMSRLKKIGAFRLNNPELYEFDQFSDNQQFFAQILKGDLIDICIDDGNHSDKAVLSTLKSAVPYLSDRFVYFVEDNSSVYLKVKDEYPFFSVRSYGPMTVITRTL